MTIDTDHFKKVLEEEYEELVAQLSAVARRNPDKPSDWEAIPQERDVSQADENVVADAIADSEDTQAMINTLDARYKDVRSGLDKIKHGVFGICQVCKEEIELDRLEANPAARTCKSHMQ